MTERSDILIADDHPLFRRGLREVISAQPDMRVVYEADTGDEAIDYLQSSRVDIAILDITMPGLDGIEVAERMSQLGLSTQVMFMTMHRDEYLFNRALDFGVRGYILKENAVTDVLQGIRMVAEGNFYISPLVSEYLVRRSTRYSSPQREGIDALTPAERRILLMISKQMTSPQIANELGIAMKTVENHRSNMCRKLGLSGVNALIYFAMQHRGVS
jgi:two-component system response regulator DegU